MSPSPGSKVASRAIKASLDAILASMDEDSEYVQLVAHHRRKFKVPWEEMHSFLEQLCRSCLSVLTAQQGRDHMAMQLRRLQQDLKREREDFKAKLVECNLTALKQLDVAKGGSGSWEDNDKVIFYEPMKYLSEAHRDLVLMVVKEKLRQLLEGTAPGSFLSELQRSLGLDPASLRQESGQKAEDVEEDDEEEEENHALEVARAAARRAQDLLAVSSKELEETKKSLVQLQVQVEERGAALAEAQQQLEAGERYRQQLVQAMDRLKDQGLEPMEATFVLSETFASLDGTFTDFESLFENAPEDCTSENVAQWHRQHGIQSLVSVDIQPDAVRRRSSLRCRYQDPQEAQEALQLLQDTVVTSEGGQSQVHAKRAGEGLVARVKSKARGKVEEADGKAKTERAESKGIDKVREELRKGSQADGLCATGDGFREGKRETSKPRRADLQAEVAQKSQQLEETTEENKKLKVCLEELQAKVRQLMGNCKERGMEKEIDEIATNIGLKRVLSCPSRFDILYQDAFLRMERLERLRAQFQAERSGSNQEAPEASVRSLIEHSPLVILQQLLSEGPAGFALQGGSPKRRLLHSQSERTAVPASSASPASPTGRSPGAATIAPRPFPPSAHAPKAPSPKAPHAPRSPVLPGLRPRLHVSASAPSLPCALPPLWKKRQ
ncbi:unnamed protein product [Effrenium voratum]|uniref:Uncharacterized protein n=1 Tax=Effrenium voratum TaxID=2562239 RepID=A0AA36MMJ2_9DINO|nr:unnamed protein product [Effrenium voratum]CAJ1452917.1 unnamed protein product [Effrenium voratum]